MPHRICAYCGTEVEPGHRFCPNCFRPLSGPGTFGQDSRSLFCPYCGYENEPNSLYCNRCGFQLMERCSICGTLSPIEGSVTCPKCGTPLIAGRELSRNLKKRNQKYRFLFRLYLTFLFLSLVLAALWWAKFSLSLSISYRYLGLIALCLLVTILIFALLNTYHNLSVARKEEQQIKHWGGKE